ncbi:MAG: precorrin-6A reductase [Microcoleaceae cyanobacterium]
MQVTQGRIWLIGGTHESAELARAIVAEQLSCTITVTTAAAKALYPPESELLQVWVGRLQAEHISAFLNKHQIRAILDASHPFAVEISKLAIITAERYQIPYLRYERPDLKVSSLNESSDHPSRFPLEPVDNWIKAPLITYLPDFQSLFTGGYLTGKRVMLTLGYRNLVDFQPWQDQSALFVRILPAITSLEAALQAGFTPDRIIALRPPVSPDLEQALWQHWQISLVVTKASGITGGEDVKRWVAARLGIPLIIIQRPEVNYPQQTTDLATVLQFCHSKC